MMSTTKPDTTVTVEQIDTKHLAKQAMRLYSKRYAKFYDTRVAGVDAEKKGYVTYKEFMEFHAQDLVSGKSVEETRDMANKSWLVITGGCPPEEVDKLTSQLCIDLMMKGLHTSGTNKRENWKQHLNDIALYHFVLIDLDGDGKISKEEWKCHIQKFFDMESAKGSFEAMDINADGVIDKHEWQTCHEGFFLSIDEERFHHFFGRIDY